MPDAEKTIIHAQLSPAIVILTCQEILSDAVSACCVSHKIQTPEKCRAFGIDTTFKAMTWHSTDRHGKVSKRNLYATLGVFEDVRLLWSGTGGGGHPTRIAFIAYHERKDQPTYKHILFVLQQFEPGLKGIDIAVTIRLESLFP